MLLLTGLIVSPAADDTGTSHVGLSEKLSHSESLDAHIQQSAKDFAARIKAYTITPEDRAILFEIWQKEEEPLQQQAKAARAELAGYDDDDTRAHSPEPPSPAPATITGDPIHADFREIESSIQAFRKSLEARKLTPEQRAVEIEQFQELNGEVLAEMAKLRRQVTFSGAFATSTVDSGTADPDRETIPFIPPSTPESDISRVIRDLSKVDPETRSQYVETHAATLEAMSREADRLSIPPTSIENSTTYSSSKSE
jgi:hypothetical protein